MARFIGLRGQMFRFFHFGHAVGAGQDQAASGHAQAFAHKKSPAFRWNVFQDFQGRHYYEYMGQDPDARNKYVGQSWYTLAEQFADEWDQTSFDPDYPTKPLSHFEPMVREVFGSLHTS